MAYDKNTDYQALINKAVAQGNYKAAAQYEQQRNEKIADLNATNTNKWNATSTSDYAGWLDKTDYSTIGQQQMDSGASWQDVLQTYNSRLDKASSTKGMEKYVNDDKQQAMMDYILANQNTPVVPTFDMPSYTTENRPTYESNYNAQIDALLNQILTREDFSYDMEADPLFQQYRSQYEREGNRAMNDTLAAAAANAGGMNSYAMTAAQQANNYYNAQLADRMPELYQIAYGMYLDDKASDVEDLGLLKQMDNTQYNRYRDTMADWENDRDFAYNYYRDQMGDYQWGKNFDYNASRDKVEDAWRDKNFDYNVSRDQIEDAWRNQEWEEEQSRYDNETAYARAMDLINAGVMPDAEMLAAAGLSNGQASLLIAAVQAAKASKSSSSGGSNRGGSNKSTTSKDDDNDGNGYVEKPDNQPNDGPDEETTLRISMDSLGLGPVSAEVVNAIRGAGGIIYDEKTNTVKWANGWNKNNWQTKMQSAGSIPGIGYNPYGLGSKGFVF